MKSLVILLFSLTLIAGQGPSDDEFVGPFPSWVNLQTVYNAKGDGTTNDAPAIQSALNDLGSPGHNHVLWVPCGNYFLNNQGLTIDAKKGVSVIGADPTCVRFFGIQSGVMLFVNATSYSQFNRITFDGGQYPGVVLVDDRMVDQSGFFDTGNQYTDDVFMNADVGIRCGYMVNGCSEMSILRDQFLTLSSAGVMTGNYNALNLWIRYSIFDHCGTGVGDYIQMADGTTFNGAGNFHVYSSIFRYSTNYDIHIGNTLEYSFRSNYFIGSPTAIRAEGTSNPAPMTIQGNRFIDQTTSAIFVANQGPVTMLDNVVRSLPNAVAPVAWTSSDMIAVGNTFTLPNANQVALGGRLFDDQTTVVPISSIDGTEPVIPGVPQNQNRPIADLPAGSPSTVIQSAIMSAVPGTRSIIHLPEGSYPSTATLTFPAGSDVQLTGDGFFATILTGSPNPLFQINGPSHVTLREFLAKGTFNNDVLRASIDQTGSRLWAHGVQMMDSNNAANANLFIDGLTSLDVELEDSSHGEVNGTGIKVSVGSGSMSKVQLWSGTTCCSTIPYQVTSGTVLIRDTWNENPGPAFASLSGSSTVTFDGMHAALNQTGQSTPGISINSFTGPATVLAANLQDRILVSGKSKNSNVLDAGGFANCPVVHPYLTSQSKPPGQLGLLQNRECTKTVPGTASIPTPNNGNNSAAFIESALAQTRAAQQQPLTTLPNTATDLRLYRVWTANGLNNIHLTRR